MNHSEPVEKPLDPAQAAIVAKVRWMMLITGLTTFLGIAAVVGVIGYRVFHAEGSADATNVTAALPKGAKVIATAVARNLVVVTIDVGGAVEIRTFDIKTLKPISRLRFANEP